MATKVVMEALSPTMEEGRLVKWLKNEGDAVKSGDVLGEVETDKAIMELVARGDGVLRKRLLDENATAAVGTLIAVIAAPDENIDDLTTGAPTTTPAPSTPAPSAPATEAAPAPAPSAPRPAPSAQPASAPAAEAPATAAPSAPRPAPSAQPPAPGLRWI